MFYKRFEVDEETPVQFIGVYTTHWQPEWGQPEAMFREVDEDELSDWLDEQFKAKIQDRRECCVCPICGDSEGYHAEDCEIGQLEEQIAMLSGDEIIDDIWKSAHGLAP